MDYHDMYFELFRVQADVIEELERLTDRLKIAQMAVEEMVLNAKDNTGNSDA